MIMLCLPFLYFSMESLASISFCKKINLNQCHVKYACECRFDIFIYSFYEWNVSNIWLAYVIYTHCTAGMCTQQILNCHLRESAIHTDRTWENTHTHLPINDPTNPNQRSVTHVFFICLRLKAYLKATFLSRTYCLCCWVDLLCVNTIAIIIHFQLLDRVVFVSNFNTKWDLCRHFRIISDWWCNRRLF